MSFQRESHSILRIGSILNAFVMVDRQSFLYLDQQTPVKYIKCYGVITDKTLDDQINQSTGSTDYLLKIDDGTGSIWVQVSNKNSEELQKWDFIRVIGYILLDTSNGKEYEVTIMAEGVVKILEKEWELVHILESTRNKPKRKQSNISEVKPKQSSQDRDSKESSDESSDQESTNNQKGIESLTQKIERILRENDSGNGVEFSTILSLSGVTDESEVDDILFELAYEGKVYQPRPDYYKIMD